MGNFSGSIRESDETFIKNQKIFFVATSPLDKDAHINLSPKGGPDFRVLSSNKVAYMDLVGSGNETSAHLMENGRICFMFCAFDGPPNILRLYGKGYTVLPGHKEWEQLASLFKLKPGTRQIIVADIDKVQTSCGFSVPYYEYKGERDHADKWASKKGTDGLELYKKEKNVKSLDGLPTPLSERYMVS